MAFIELLVAVLAVVLGTLFGLAFYPPSQAMVFWDQSRSLYLLLICVLLTFAIEGIWLYCHFFHPGRLPGFGWQCAFVFVFVILGLLVAFLIEHAGGAGVYESVPAPFESEK